LLSNNLFFCLNGFISEGKLKKEFLKRDKKGIVEIGKCERVNPTREKSNYFYPTLPFPLFYKVIYLPILQRLDIRYDPVILHPSPQRFGHAIKEPYPARKDKQMIDCPFPHLSSYVLTLPHCIPYKDEPVKHVIVY